MRRPEVIPHRAWVMQCLQRASSSFRVSYPAFERLNLRVVLFSMAGKTVLRLTQPDGNPELEIGLRLTD
jgi:hypothetical protein